LTSKVVYIKYYTEAIDICLADQKDDIATFYQNRAAAYEQLKKCANVVYDCKKALEHNNRTATEHHLP